MADTAVQDTELRQPARMEIEDNIAVIRLDQRGKPVNVLSREMVEAMEGIIDQLERAGRDAAGIRAAVIISEKPGTWIAGADIEEFKTIETAADGERLSRNGQRLLNRLERLPIPTVAAINGAALGGGLEVALACTYRIASTSPKTKLGLPEVQLGILPGAGGTQRLPRLVGLRSALDLMLTGKQLDARRAKKIGLVDEVAPPEVLLRAAKQAARELAGSEREPRTGRRKGSPEWTEQLPGMKTIIFRKAREGVMEKTGGLYPAPLRILEVTEQGIERSLEEGLILEARAFGELSATPESRALVHLFFATTAAKNDPELPTDARAETVDHLAVVGAGFMGAGIATVSAEKGIRVRLKDVSPEAVAKGYRTARESLVKRAKKRRRPRFEVTQLVDRVEPTSEYTGFRHTDLVIEAVFEDLELKHQVIRDIEQASGAETIVASNTSTIPIEQLAEASRRPEQMLGLHFFSPVEKMPLLEIIVTSQTDPSAAATGHAYGKRIGKTPIIVNDAPGFYVNRILSPYMAEAALLLEEGVRIETIDRAMKSWGFPVGPITLYDEVGLDVAQKAGRIMAEAFSDRMEPSSVVDRMVADGRLGRKNSRGFFLYEDGKRGDPDSAVYTLLGTPSPHEYSEQRIQERLSLLMINEAIRCLEERVIRSARDGDVGAVLGIGFPPFRGGPFWYVDQVGVTRMLARLRELEQSLGSRFAPAQLLIEKADYDGRFSEDLGEK